MTTDINQVRNARMRAKRLGLRMVKTGELVTLYDAAGELVTSGGLDFIGPYLAARFERRAPGPARTPMPVLWRPWVDAFIAEQRAARRREGTVTLRVTHLARFARSLPGSDPRAVTRAELVAYLARPEWTPRTAHSLRTTFRVFFRTLSDLGHRGDDPARKLPAVKVPRSLPRPCPDHVVRKAFDAVTDNRVRLGIRVAVETGMRRGEIARLRTADVIGRPGSMWLHVVGKGGHERTVPVSDELAAEILAVPTVHVFPAYGGGHITPRHLGKLVARALPGEWTMHALRHRFATRAYAADRDLRAVQELLGHQSPVTTAVYTRVSDESVRRAAQAAAVPGGHA
ncbi:Putative integrase (Phage integrase family protein) [Mycobacteroides abscessus subsp. abscessus]|uniref:tyrosine-type recombinase/integrase n=1 Tax=Mycobacteroides abscessus TaxID=36809 RepID=UPI0009A76636|nr:tyrosine-type recombinase/integrase [Mycobacteroides abscessus]SKD91809.1 Putative integrase (Phage integrase family protein) [Mycobacteroides abscessus subsp. abscessus]